MAIVLCSIVDCEMLNLLRVYKATCFGHVLFKTCQYATNDDKVFMGLRQVSVKDAQIGLQKNNYLDKNGKEVIMGENVC
jgi:hypothetical protein